MALPFSVNIGNGFMAPTTNADSFILDFFLLQLLGGCSKGLFISPDCNYPVQETDAHGLFCRRIPATLGLSHMKRSGQGPARFIKMSEGFKL